MNDSLSILLPIHNAQSTLADDIAHLLDVAAEVTDRFDVLILDDASIDRTEEVAWELTTEYSQVTYVRFPEQRGLVSALRAGLSETRGDFIVACNTERRLSWDKLPQLWANRNEPAMEVLDEEESPRWLKRLMHWGRGLQQGQHPEPFTMRIMHRDDVAAWNTLDAALGHPYLDRARQRQGDEEQRDETPAPMPVRVSDQTRLDGASSAGGPVWPNVAGHVQDFALGE